MEPRGVVFVEAEVAAEKKERSHDGGHGWRLDVLVAFPYPENLVQKGGAGREVGRRARVPTRGQALWNLHARLDHHESAQGGDQAIGLDRTVETQGRLLQA